MTNEFLGNLLLVVPEHGVQGGQRHVLQRPALPADGKGSREVREGGGLEGDEGEGPPALCSWALSLQWVSAPVQVRRCRLEDSANTPSIDAMWCINKQALRAWQDCLSYLVQAILCPAQEFFLLYIFKCAKPQWMQAFPLGSLPQVACFPCQGVLQRLQWQPHAWVFSAEKEETHIPCGSWHLNEDISGAH